MLKNIIKARARTLYYFIGGFPPVASIMNRYRGSAAIIVFHRVLPSHEIADDLTKNAIPIEQFESQMKHLAQYYLPIAIDDISADSKNDDRLPVVVTFDDGYKDNLTHALPILKKYQIPATIYITTKFPEGDGSMWWYELYDLCLKKDAISFKRGDEFHEWLLKTKKDRDMCYADIHAILLSSNYSSQNEIMNQIRDGIKPASYGEICLTWEEIKLLDEEPLITIGAHTHSHPVLAQLTLDDAFSEMLISKQLLEKHLKHKVEHLSYPFGNTEHAGEREYTLAKEIGCKTAVTTISGSINATTGLFNLPRHGISSAHHDIKILDVKLSGWSAFWGRQL
jgi:peptidoglycan/xylan/chitin deacetylase (PgdA/CDA1 family)